MLSADSKAEFSRPCRYQLMGGRDVEACRLRGRSSTFLYFPLCCLSPLLLLGVVYSETIHGGAGACFSGGWRW